MFLRIIASRNATVANGKFNQEKNGVKVNEREKRNEGRVKGVEGRPETVVKIKMRRPVKVGRKNPGK
jgi:hypothetical protein